MYSIVVLILISSISKHSWHLSLEMLWFLGLFSRVFRVLDFGLEDLCVLGNPSCLQVRGVWFFNPFHFEGFMAFLIHMLGF